MIKALIHHKSRVFGDFVSVLSPKIKVHSQVQCQSSPSGDPVDGDAVNSGSLQVVMPSKQQQQDVLAVEELVHEIKENLRLKAPPPPSALMMASTTTTSTASSTLQQLRSHRRPSPYHIPCRSWSDTCSTTPGSGNESSASGSGFGGEKSSSGCLHHFSHHSHHHHHLSSSHHLHLHHRKGSSTGSSSKSEDIDDPYELLQVLIKNNSLVKEAVRRLQLNLSPKQRYFYESDEDSSRSPLLRMCQLEL